MDDFSTHEVVNQVPPLGDYCLFETDTVLKQGVAREGAGDWSAELAEHGTWLGRRGTLALGDQANRFPPRLLSYDATGHRIDRVEFHPAWHLLMDGIVSRGLHSAAWISGRPGAQVARAAGYLMQGQVEAGTLCPTTMTFAAFACLRDEPAAAMDLQAEWLPKLASRRYDASDRPASSKTGLLIGMGLTEKQGGSDLRAVSSRAYPLGAAGRGQRYRIVGHKWFYSVPQADAHLVLARTDEGLSCLLVPRWMPGQARNAIRLRRLKDKLGNLSNASAEVEFENAEGILVGEPGHGLAVLLKMAACTRLDCVLGSAALMRQALVQAMHHATRRHAFGHPLIEQPLMRNLLADLALESEAACMLALRLARASDERADPAACALLRIGTPAAKLWVCKRAVTAVAECLEVLGGNGYIEDAPLARLYRETPVNSIWEGSGNIMALDVLRALRDSGTLDSLEQEFVPVAGISSVFDQRWTAWRTAARQAGDVGTARFAAAELSRLWQAALLMAHAPAAVSEAFVASRLQGPQTLFGELAAVSSHAEILARAWVDI